MGSSSSFMGASYGWFVCPRLHRAVVQEPRHSPNATLTRANTPGEHGERPVGDRPGRAEAAEGLRQPLLELRQILQHCLTRAAGSSYSVMGWSLVAGEPCWGEAERHGVYGCQR